MTRQRLAIALVIVAGLASLATTQEDPTLRAGVWGDLTFTPEDRVETRQVRLAIDVGRTEVRTTASVTVSAHLIYVLAVRDRDGRMWKGDWERQTSFDPFESCPTTTRCEESFTLSFELAKFDRNVGNPALSSWALDVLATDAHRGSAAPRPDARLSVTKEP